MAVFNLLDVLRCVDPKDWSPWVRFHKMPLHCCEASEDVSFSATSLCISQSLSLDTYESVHVRFLAVQRMKHEI